MKLISTWGHYLEFQCSDCGEIAHVDAARNFPSVVACHSSKCRTSPQQLEAVANGARLVQIGTPAGPRGC